MSNPLLARFTGAAVAVFAAPEMQAQFEACLTHANVQIQSAEFQAAQVAADGSDDFWSFDPASYLARLRPYVVKDGVLQIPVKGVLLHDFPYALGSWATGYDYIWAAFQRGMGDMNVRAIALICDSPGGEVAGNFDLVDRMYALRGTKQVRGFASESAYSAAYSIISVSDPGQVTVTRTGGVGSIGVVTGHMDVSAALDKAGLKFTFISAPKGGHKTDGNPYEPLPKDVEARIQARIDALYDVFVSTVARNRGLDEQAVRDTEALTFSALDALSNGLADKIGALDDALAAYAADLQEEDENMSNQDGSVDKATHDQAVAAARAEGVTEGVAQGRTEGQAQGLKDGAVAERARISAIMGCDEAKDRPAAALAAAMDTDLTVEATQAFLAKLPKEAATVAVAPVTVSPMDGMSNTEQPGVGAEGPEADADDAASVVNLARKFGLAGFEPANAA
jgi:ClpP class serine protease